MAETKIVAPEVSRILKRPIDYGEKTAKPEITPRQLAQTSTGTGPSGSGVTVLRQTPTRRLLAGINPATRRKQLH